MKVEILILFVIYIKVCSSCCPRITNNESEFLKRYGNEDFSLFYNTEIKLRGFDDGKSLISILRYDVNEEENYQTYSLGINNNLTCYPDELDNKNCFIDLRAKSLAVHFKKYNLSYLHVDEDSNVMISLEKFEQFDMVKVKDSAKYFKSRKSNNFIKVKNNWYKRN